MSKRSTFELDEKSATGKGESLEDSANLPLDCHPEFPASGGQRGGDGERGSRGASRRKAGALPALDPDIIAAEVAKDLIHPLRGTQSAGV